MQTSTKRLDIIGKTVFSFWLLIMVSILFGIGGNAYATNATPINFGETVYGTITSISQMDSYKFDAEAGDIIFMRMNSSWPYYAELRVYYNGGLISQVDGNAYAELSNCTVQNTGTYTVLVGDDNGNDTGDYTVYLQRLNNPAETSPITIGETLYGSITTNSQMQAYTFAAESADIILLRMNSSWPYYAELRVYDPNGGLISQVDGNAYAELSNCTVQNTGTYTVLVGDDNGNNTGDYTVYLQRLNNPAETSPITIGETLYGSITTNSQMQAYTFAAESADIIFMRMNSSWPYYAELRVYDPNGGLISQVDGNAYAELSNCTVQNTGTYTVLVGDDNGNNTGDYNLYFNILYSSDTVLPISAASVSPPYWRTSSPVNVNYTASDNFYLIGITLYYRYQSPGSGSWSSWTAFQTKALSSKTATGNFVFPYPAGEGKYEFYTIARDYVDNYESAPGVADASIGFDTTSPTGYIIIANNSSGYTNSTIVTLTLNATDVLSGVTTMRFSNDGATWSTWEPYKTWRTKYLTSGNGTKYVYVQYRDTAGNVSNTYSDAIILDQTKPTGSIIINSGATYTGSTVVTLTLSATDSLSGVTTMRFSNDSTTWSIWEPYKTWRTKYLTPSDGTKHIYVEYQDKAGNISTPYSTSIILETMPPTGSISINGGTTYTSSTVVTLTLSATDNLSGVTTMRFSNNGSTWSVWEPYKTWRTKYLTSGDGTKYVYVEYQDKAGNISTPYPASIILETVPPTGSIVINGGAAYTSSTVVTLTLSATDNLSGVTTMRFSNDNSSWSSWEPYKTWRSKYLTNGEGTKYVYVQYRDKAGNVSNAYAASIILDVTGPTGSILINNGDTYTTSTVVTLALSAWDTWSGVSSMRFSNDTGTTWSIWESYKTSRSKYLTPGAGTKTVTVQYMDGAKNQSTPYTASIILQNP